MVKNPNWRRQSSWLFTKRVGFVFGATEDKSIQWQGGGLETGTSGFILLHPLAVSCRKQRDTHGFSSFKAKRRDIF